MTLKSSIYHTLLDRGYIHQSTDENGLDNLLNSKKIPFYIGFDCTADSLHVGSLVQLMMIRHFQRQGYKPILLIGGGTTKVGDPSGKDEARKLLSSEDIQRNIDGISNVFKQFIKLTNNVDSKSNDAILVNNADWLEGLNYIEFLRDIGRHFSINRMLSFDSVKLRLDREQNLSFLEFNYMLLQAYDFAELNKRYGCRLQCGGSDQWGNIVNGVELNRRLGYDEVFGITTPLLTTATGAKMGKTAQGAVWLSADKLSPYDYWQFWRNTDDRDVGRFLRLFTELPIDKIIELEKLGGNEINEAKKILANEATKICHGEEAASHAAETARKTFEENKFGDDLPIVNINRSELVEGVHLYNAYKLTGLVTSNGEARRLIEGGGAKVNDQKIDDVNFLIKEEAIAGDNLIKISAGKKKHALLRVI